MKIDDNGIIRDMTPDEEAEYIANKPQKEEKAVDTKTALQSFFEGFRSSETTSIAKIRALAKKFIEDTEIDTAISAQYPTEIETIEETADGGEVAE